MIHNIGYRRVFPSWKSFVVNVFRPKEGIERNFALNRNWLLGLLFLQERLPLELKSEIRCAMKSLEILQYRSSVLSAWGSAWRLCSLGRNVFIEFRHGLRGLFIRINWCDKPSGVWREIVIDSFAWSRTRKRVWDFHYYFVVKW